MSHWGRYLLQAIKGAPPDVYLIVDTVVVLLHTIRSWRKGLILLFLLTERDMSKLISSLRSLLWGWIDVTKKCFALSKCLFVCFFFLVPGDLPDALGFESLLSMLLSYQSLRLNCCCHIPWEHERLVKQQGPCLQASSKHHELVQSTFDLLHRCGTIVCSG